jgi:hypothetical protein
MCHFNSVHYVNFEEIWSGFQKFGNSEKKKENKPEKPRGNFENFSQDFKIRKFRKSFNAFSVFFTRHALHWQILQSNWVNRV